MALRLVDPTVSSSDEILPAAPRLQSLGGLRLGLIANGKTHSLRLLERIAANLDARHGLAGTRSLVKSRVNEPPEPEDLESFAQECGAILAAIGD